MIALKVLFCSFTPGSASTASSRVSDRVSAGCGVDRRGEIGAVAADDQHLHDAIGDGVGPVRVLHRAPRVERDPQAALLEVVGVLHPTVDDDRGLRRSDEHGVADRDAGVLQGVVGPRMAGRRRIGDAVRRDLVAGDGHVGQLALARDAGAEQGEAEPAHLGHPVDVLDERGCRVTTAAQERVAGRPGVDDASALWARIAPVEPR